MNSLHFDHMEAVFLVITQVHVILIESRTDQLAHRVMDQLAQQTQKMRRRDQDDVRKGLLAMPVMQDARQFMCEVLHFDILGRGLRLH
jgi:hypothetical protein